MVRNDAVEETLYQKLKKVMAPGEIDHHYSDLYVLANEKSLALLKECKAHWSMFKSNIDGKMWYDIPFGYDPYWEQRDVKVSAVAAVSEAVAQTQALVKPPGTKVRKSPRLSR
jgi:hypothetical protein